MSRSLEVLRLALIAVCLSGAACIPFDEDRSEFCANADPGRAETICPSAPRADGGARDDAGSLEDAGPDEGPPPDAGVDGGVQGECDTVAQCPARGETCRDYAACIDHKCRYFPQEDGTPCSATPTAECRESTGTCSGGVCQNTPRGTGSCNDGVACTINDACNSSGVCAGTLLSCDSPPSCMKFAGTCNNGQCDYVPAATGTACNDGNYCTVNDACDGAGNCISNQELDCQPMPEQCLIAACDPSVGCTYSSRCAANLECRYGTCCVPGLIKCSDVPVP